MKYQFNKQAMLKLSLLAVLAANVSFEPLRPALHETLLSSETRSANTSVPATPRDGQTASAPQSAAASNQDPITNLRNVGNAVDVNVCGGRVKHRITFQEGTRNRSIITVATSVPRENTNSATAKLAWMRPYNEETRLALRTAVELKLVRENCPSQASTTAAAPSAPAATTTTSSTTTTSTETRPAQTTTTTATESEETQENDPADLERRVANCEMKKTRIRNAWEYRTLEGRERARCQVRRLRNLHKDLKAELGRRPTADELADAAREIVNDETREEIREMLDDARRDKDPEALRDAEEIANELGEGLESFRERHNIRDRDLRNLERSMKGYERLADVGADTLEFDTRIDNLRSRMALEKRNFDMTRNPIHQQNLLALQQQGVGLFSSYYNSMLYQDPFYQIEANNWLSQSEISPWRNLFDPITAEYRGLQSYLVGASNLDSFLSNSGSIVQRPLPEGLALYGERNMNAAGNRLNGLSYSSYPSDFPGYNIGMDRNPLTQRMGLPPANRAGGVLSSPKMY